MKMYALQTMNGITHIRISSIHTISQKEKCLNINGELYQVLDGTTAKREFENILSLIETGYLPNEGKGEAYECRLHNVLTK